MRYTVNPENVVRIAQVIRAYGTIPEIPKMCILYGPLAHPCTELDDIWRGSGRATLPRQISP